MRVKNCSPGLRFNLLLHIDLNHDFILDNMGGKAISCACAKGSPTEKVAGSIQALPK